MKKYIYVLLTFTDGRKYPPKTITIESSNGMHELEIYTILDKLVPAFISVNYDDEKEQCGYSYEYKNGLSSVTIYRAN